MSRYFNRSQRQRMDRALPAAPSKQADLNRVLEEVSQLGIANEVKRAPVLSSCRKLKLPVSSDQPLLLAKSSVPEQAIESYRALRTRLMRIQADLKLRSIVMSSAMAREGKTLTSFNLALSCSRISNYRVLVID